jgi:hypothetical protein
MERTDESEVDTVVESTKAETGGVQIDVSVQRGANNLLNEGEINAGQFGSVIENAAALELAFAASVIGLGQIDINAKIRGVNGGHGGGKGEKAGSDGELHFEYLVLKSVIC